MVCLWMEYYINPALRRRKFITVVFVVRGDSPVETLLLSFECRDSHECGPPSRHAHLGVVHLIVQLSILSVVHLCVVGCFG